MRVLPPSFTPAFSKAARAFFLANRRASREGSDALASFRWSFDKPASRTPRDGSPLGIGGAETAILSLERRPDEGDALADEACERGCCETLDFFDVAALPLQRCTLSDRFANLSLSESSARISSMQLRSCHNNQLKMPQQSHWNK